MTTDYDTALPPAAEEQRPRVAWRASLLVAGAVVAVAAGLGALGGRLWYSWWGPPASGRIFDTDRGIRWYPDPWDPGQHQVFAGTAEYVLVGLAGAVLLGAFAAFVGRRQALAALAALVVGSALAAYVHFAVGTAMSPPDPQRYATEEHVDEEYPAAIEVTGWSPYLVWPGGALGAFCVAAVVVSWLEELRRAQSVQRKAGTWLEPRVSPARSEPPPPPSA